MSKVTMRALDVRVSDTSTAWGSMTSLCADVFGVDVSGGSRNVGEGYAGCRDTAYIGSGKRTPEEITVNALFDDGAAAGDAYEEVRSIHEDAPGTIFMRWAPEGSTTDAYVFYAEDGIVNECPPPSGNVEDGEPISFSFGVTCAEIVSESL